MRWFEKYSPRDIEDWKADWRIGVLGAVIANSHSKGGFEPEDIMPHLRQEEFEPASEQQVQRRLMAWCVQAGGSVVREPRKES